MGAMSFNADKTEQRVEYYLKTAMDGFKVFEPIVAVLLGLVILVIAVPFFVVGVARHVLARAGQWVSEKTPDWAAKQFSRLFTLWMNMMLIQFRGTIPSEWLGGGNRQTKLSEYSE